MLRINLVVSNTILVTQILFSILASNCCRNEQTNTISSNEGELIQRKLLIDTLILKSKVFNNTRRIRVLLPPGYFDQNEQERRYPVLYINDGVMVFNEYDLEDLVPQLISEGKIDPLIIVGIDNGGSTFESKSPVKDRANEYLPWPDEFETNPNFQVDDPQGRLYPQFLIGEVVPMIDKSFRTKPGSKNRGLGGASRGALISLYTAIKHPSMFGMLLLESPSLYVSQQKVLKLSNQCETWPDKVYIGIGTREGDTPQIQNMALGDAQNLNEIISERSRSTSIRFYAEKGGEHSFYHFKKRFPVALSFLFSQ